MRRQLARPELTSSATAMLYRGLFGASRRFWRRAAARRVGVVACQSLDGRPAFPVVAGRQQRHTVRRTGGVGIAPPQQPVRRRRGLHARQCLRSSGGGYRDRGRSASGEFQMHSGKPRWANPRPSARATTCRCRRTASPPVPLCRRSQVRQRFERRSRRGHARVDFLFVRGDRLSVAHIGGQMRRLWRRAIGNDRNFFRRWHHRVIQGFDRRRVRQQSRLSVLVARLNFAVVRHLHRLLVSEAKPRAMPRTERPATARLLLLDPAAARRTVLSATPRSAACNSSSACTAANTARRQWPFGLARHPESRMARPEFADRFGACGQTPCGVPRLPLVGQAGRQKVLSAASLGGSSSHSASDSSTTC